MAFWTRWNNITYMWTNGILETLPDSFTDNISPRAFKKKVGLILKDVGADFLRFFKSSKIPKNKIWYLALTKNNFDALKMIQEITPDSIFVSFFRFRSTINEETYYFLLSRKILWDIFYPLAWIIYTFNYPKKGLRYFDLLITAHGTYYECIRLIKTNKPKAIVFTNDHLIIARSLLLAANHLGVKTYYVQHASVSNYFPPLEFTYAMLDGDDAFLKYKQCGEVKSEIHLVGMAKFDNYSNRLNQNKNLKTLGIAYNLVDDVDDVMHFTDQIVKMNGDINIMVRPHPGDDREIKFGPEITVSDSKVESAFSFLTTIDALIAGDSSIHLEATLLNVYPLYYNFTISKRFDFYDFVKMELIEYFQNVNDVNSKLTELKINKPFVQGKAKYYNAAIGSDFYGKSTERIADMILKTINS